MGSSASHHENKASYRPNHYVKPIFEICLLMANNEIHINAHKLGLPNNSFVPCLCFQQKSRHHRDYTVGPPPLLPPVAVPELSSPPPHEADNFEEEDDYDLAEDEILSKQSECCRHSSLLCPSAEC